MEQSMESLISIVLPIYNGEKYMRKSIDSVLAQTYENWELLIVDDGSNDNTAVIAQEYAAKASEDTKPGFFIGKWRLPYMDIR